MYALSGLFALALTMLAATTPAITSATPATAPAVNAVTKLGTCPSGEFLSWVGTIYYSDPARTEEVGSCAITCRQFVDDDFPTFGGGGTCSGTSGPYELMGFNCCPPRN
jgi:hypothetical protein